jgi:hypothetical protein
MVRIWLLFTVLAMVGFQERLAEAADPPGAAPADGNAAATGGVAAPVPSATTGGTAASAPSAPSPDGNAAAAGGTAPAAASPRPPSAGGPDTGVDATAATAGVPMVDATIQSATPAVYGVGARLRMTSVPKWLLGLFLDSSVPLTSYTAGMEFFRRTGNFDLVLGLAYQPLSPDAGNWLGKGNPSSTDTDYIQFDGLAAYSFDAAFILHTAFNEYVGMHYGGGVGIGITTGRMLRTSNGSNGPNGTTGCAIDPSNVTLCHPVVCQTGPCTEGQLKATEGGTDGPMTPSRFSDNHIPTVFPIVNLITGLDFRVPNVPGFAVKFDMGYFFPYFFLGGSVAYQI